MRDRAPVAVHSWQQLQERIASIADELNRDPRLAVAAAANPLAALEELGYRVEPAARPEIEDRLRFPPREAAQRKRLRERIFREAGRGFDPDSPEELRRVLYEELAITPYPDGRGCYPDPPDTRPPRRPVRGPAEPDPLRALEGRHPVVAPLLEYRALGAGRPPFAPPAAYEAIRSGAAPTGIRGLRVRLKRDAPPPPAEPVQQAPPGPAKQAPPAAGPARLDVNSAGAAELERLPGVGARLAARIVAHREEHGRFESVEALRRVPGITERVLAAVRPHVTTQP